MFTESSGLWGIFAAAALSRHDAVQLWMSAPFILLLVMIAMMPLAGKKLKRFWERFYPAISIAAGLVVAAYYVWLVPGGAHDVWHSVKEYVSFIALVGSLFVISGGITIKLNGEATPKTNVIFLLFGALLSNAIGTTGASMVLIRPWMRMNRYRLSAFHIVFFIFIVSNVGGALTPIGDPPLYIGYLRGVDFFWVFEHANLPWAFVVASLLGVFYLMDLRSFRKAGARGLAAEKSAARMMCSVRGAKNIGWLLVVVCAVFLPGQVPAPARELLETYFVREIVMVAGQSPELQTQLREHGVNVTWAYLDNLTRGYGAAHCMTQVVRRVAQDDTESGIRTLTADGASCRVEGGRGVIRLMPSHPMRIGIYGVEGDSKVSRHISAETSVKAAPGFYIVVAGNSSTGVKVVVEE